MNGSSLSATLAEMPKMFWPSKRGVAAFHAVQHHAAMASQVVAHDRRSVAGHVERCPRPGRRTASVMNFSLVLWMKKRSLPSAAIHAQRLDVDEADRQAGAEHAVLGDHEVVAELGADDDHGVEAVAAVDVDRRIDGVLHQVGACAAGDVRALALRLLRAGQGEGADLEDIVAALRRSAAARPCCGTRRSGRSPSAAVDGHRLADAVGQEAARGLDGGEHRHRTD